MNETWIQKHERFLLIGGIIVILFVLGWKLLDHLDSVDKLKASVDQTQLDQQKKQTDDLAKNFTDLQKQTATLNSVLENDNQQLENQIQIITRTLAAQQASDARLSNDDLIKRLELLTNQQNLQSNPTGGVNLDKDQTVTTTQTLEQIPALNKQVEDQKQQIANKDNEINNLTTQNNSASLLLTNLNTELADQKKTCSAEITSIKVAGFKSKLRWFGAGYAAGFITKLFVHVP